MKLYFSPGACSLAPHIALHESGLAADTIQVDLRKHTLEGGDDYYAINPRGYVPLLVLDDGTKLTEVQVILQYLADRKPGTLAPIAGTAARWKLMEWLGFIATEIHKGFSPLWHADDFGEKGVASIKAKLAKRYEIVEKQLARTPFIAGDAFTVADAYLFTITSWAGYLKFDLSAFPNVVAYVKRIGDRPAVKAALAAERRAKQPA